MKRILTSALILALSIGAAQAQQTNPAKGQGQQKEQRGRHLGQKGEGMDKLNLTADQKAKMQALRADFKKQADALKAQENTLTVTQMKEKRKALHEQHMTQMQAILTPEQREQLTQMRAQHQEFGRDRKNGQGRFDSTGRRNFDGVRGNKGQGFERGADLAKELNLTADQQTRVQQIRSDFRSKMEALRNDNSLSQEEKRTKFRELSKAQQEQMKSVLTKEQLQKMQSLRQERSNKNTK